MKGDSTMSSKPNKERYDNENVGDPNKKDMPGQSRQPNQQGQPGQPQQKDDQSGQQGNRGGEQKSGQR
jgi:hypothetical protein